jgi:uncharacterized protein with HEPN domain
MEADQLGRLRDVMEAARLIGTYVEDATETDFRSDTQKQDAVPAEIGTLLVSSSVYDSSTS